jgi:hypothetical protein
MNFRVQTPIAVAIAIAAGALVLISLLLPGLEEVRNRILNWAILLSAIALLLGLANLFNVHFDRIRNKQKPFYSAILLIAMLFTFGITLWEGSGSAIPSWILSNIQIPIETSLMAVLAVTLTLAAARLLQRRTDLMTIVFIVALFVILLGSGPLFGIELPLFTSTLGPIIGNFLATGAMRGLLIGVSIGTLLTGLRILIGADRPYGG